MPCCDLYEEGSGTILIRDVTCDSSDIHITACMYTNNTVHRSHQQDVGVQCQQGKSKYT